jgi:N-hydroxyarylamine O-acetyltransferase
MKPEIDLDAYFRRIGYRGPRTPTLATLRAIHLLHPQAIPFENLDSFLRRPVLLDPAALERKLVREGRGGYCFEQNLLLKHVLEGLGFDATGLAARVLWNAPEGAVTARGHMLLRVDLDGESYVADVGFGGLTLTAPLHLETGVEQATPHERFRLVVVGDAFVMQAAVRGEWKPLYRFDLQEQLLPDYEVSSWYLSNHPRSHFVTGLVAARAGAIRRWALRGTELAVHHLDGRTERRTLADATELREALEGPFGLTLPEEPGLDAALERLVTQVGDGSRPEHASITQAALRTVLAS